MAKKTENIPTWKKKIHRFLVKSESDLSKLRKRIIVDPKTHFFTSQPLRQANKFLKKLYKDDSFYFSARYAWTRPEDAKKLFLYGCARQVMKAAVVLMENEEHILEAPQKKVDTMGRIIIESIIDTQNIILRKHIELLVNLINFSSFNKDIAYRIFLNAENLEHYIGRQSDFRTFHESESSNVKFSMKVYSDRINSDLKTLKIQNIWFLKKSWVKKTSPPIFESVRKRFITAIPHSTDDEKIITGITYNDFFGRYSASAHSFAGSRMDNQKFNTIKKNISFISLLGQHIISRANQLMGFDDDPQDVQKIMAKGSDAPKFIKRWKREFVQGDIVLANNELCEIVECKTSRLGYTSCKVKFLIKPPLPETPEDWLPGAFVNMIFPKKQARNFLLKNKGNKDNPKELNETLEMMSKETDDVLMKCLKGAIVDLHKKKLLIPMLIKSGFLKQRKNVDED